MTQSAAEQPKCTSSAGSIDLIIEPRERDLGGFSVRRVLPSRERRMVGPFVFFDHIGPAVFPPGEGIQVRPHPHIGLATVTYIFEGEIIHRDSLGVVQPIQAGAVNLMTAGRGIVHSERAGEDLNATSRLHGMQIWIALPTDQEQCAPAFEHYPAPDIPELDIEGATVRVVMGEAYGHTSPVKCNSRILYLEYRLPKGACIELPETHREIAAYVVDGNVRIDQRSLTNGTMAVARPDATVQLEAEADSHVLVIGGDPVGERHIWWNFVSSSAERIEKAKVDWKERRFPEVPGENELIPLPD
jgi:redox-sensitive bicupin YhaK (pirin superfamily)